MRMNEDGCITPKINISFKFRVPSVKQFSNSYLRFIIFGTHYEISTIPDPECLVDTVYCIDQRVPAIH